MLKKNITVYKNRVKNIIKSQLEIAEDLDKYDLDNFVMSVVEELNLLSESSRKKIISQYELIRYKLFKGEKLSRKEYDLLSSLLDKDIDEKLEELTVLKLSL